MNTSKKYPSNFWIGLAQVKARDPKILGAANAYVNVVSIAESRSKFRQKIKEALETMNIQLQKLEDAEPLSLRVKKFEVDKNLLRLADSLFENPSTVKLSTFHTYD